MSANLEIEGFDQYGSNVSLLTSLSNWAERSANATLIAGRTAMALQMTESGFGSDRTRRVLKVSGNEFVMGFAFRKIGALVSSSYKFFRLLSNLSAELAGFVMTPAGEIQVLGFTSPLNTIILNAWQFVEIRIVFDAVNGEFEMRVDGVPVIGPLTGLNTGSTPISQFRFESEIDAFSSREYQLDDMYWDVGPIGTTVPMLGDSRAVLTVPDGNGALQDFSFTGAPSAWEAIDEVPDDGDTSYISALNPAEQSSFDLADVSLTLGTIHAIQTTHTSRKIDSGSGNLQAAMISVASVALGADRPMPQSYTMSNDTFEVDPNTGVGWTVAGLNAAQFRIEKTA